MGWGAYVRDKIPQQEFALKMQVGLMREGGGEGVFAGHYGIRIHLNSGS